MDKSKKIKAWIVSIVGGNWDDLQPAESSNLYLFRNKAGAMRYIGRNFRSVKLISIPCEIIILKKKG